MQAELLNNSDLLHQALLFKGRTLHVIVERDPDADEEPDEEDEAEGTLYAYTFRAYDEATGTNVQDVVFSGEEKVADAVGWVVECLESDGFLSDVVRDALQLEKGIIYLTT